MKKQMQQQTANQGARELDPTTIDNVQGGWQKLFLLVAGEFAEEIAYGVGHVLGGAATEYGNHPPAWDNGKI